MLHFHHLAVSRKPRHRIKWGDQPRKFERHRTRAPSGLLSLVLHVDRRQTKIELLIVVSDIAPLHSCRPQSGFLSCGTAFTLCLFYEEHEPSEAPSSQTPSRHGLERAPPHPLDVHLHSLSPMAHLSLTLLSVERLIDARRTVRETKPGKGT